MRKTNRTENNCAYFAKREASIINNFFHSNLMLATKVRQYHKLTTGCLYQIITCCDISMQNIQSLSYTPLYLQVNSQFRFMMLRINIPLETTQRPIDLEMPFNRNPFWFHKHSKIKTTSPSKKSLKNTKFQRLSGSKLVCIQVLIARVNCPICNSVSDLLQISIKTNKDHW